MRSAPWSASPSGTSDQREFWPDIEVVELISRFERGGGRGHCLATASCEAQFSPDQIEVCQRQQRERLRADAGEDSIPISASTNFGM
jgi:hypothetical protein